MIKEFISEIYKSYNLILYIIKNYIDYIIFNYMNDTYLKGTWDNISSNSTYLISLIIIFISSLGVILSKNPIHSVFFLILVFMQVGFFLIMLNVEFLAFLLFIVYLGAIAVLFLFVIMMFNIQILESRDNILRYMPLVIFIILIIVEITCTFEIKKEVFSINELYYNHKNWISIIFSKNNMIVLSVLYTYFIYHFVLASLILLVAMIGAIILTLNQPVSLKKQFYYKQNSKNVYNSIVLRTKNHPNYEIWKLYLKKNI